MTETGSGAGSEEAKKREALILRITKLCKRQGQFAIACQKYTQYGKKTKAMKCLVKQGNTDAIISYANAARSADVYIIAANYLQNTNWHENANLTKTIISFYSKAKAYDKLGAFFEACAQMEIDEYRNYEKALGAMNEAVNAIKKFKTSDQNLQIQVEHRMKLISDFVRAKTLTETTPEEMVKICNFLIETPDAESAIRVGDVFGHLIEYYYTNKDAKQAYDYIQKMIARKIKVNPYLDQELIDNIYIGVGMKPPSAEAEAKEGAADEITEEIEENK